MAKMLMLDGPLAGEVVDYASAYQAIDGSDIAARGLEGEYRLVTYQSRPYMFGARTIYVATCGSPSRRKLEELAFAALASDAAKAVAGPMARYVCDHQALGTCCPRGCHDAPATSPA
jgi:hypothetical protein